MDLQTGKFYWDTTLKNPPTYPPLQNDITCDVLIIGGGSSGAQCAHYLSEYDLNVVVVEKNKVGYGSTRSNTSLIQYAGEKTFLQLINSFGEDYALRHILLCKDAINEIEKASSSLEINPDFIRRNSLYYASYKEDVSKLEEEYNLLKKHNFSVEFWTEEQIIKKFPFRKYAGLYYINDAELNPYKFTIGLLEKARKKGVRIFEQTEIQGKNFKKNHNIFHTKNGNVIHANYVIIAAGYECLDFKNEKNAVMVSSYAVITNPVNDFSTWYKRSLIWESARPYVYMRTTPDNRIIIGGLDENTLFPQKRDSKLIHKKDELIAEFQKLFPNIEVSSEFYIAALYGGTHDGLPIIGKYEEFPNCYFLMAYGDNGTVYSMSLAKIISQTITKGHHKDLDLYLQTRPFLNS
ncbi:NAD(P)/FAD-dependent oxidoreductase [Inediibacterium massiliense]|uniref:NAD(P)/FAD-dependent oxidoreductase n=1 Tax=Inediibacterium massiliense TaxID=1658111 RepID=UPI0006B6186F|nr:FAD-dependent oxidoreductase [Inediibacterium massiliense]